MSLSTVLISVPWPSYLFILISIPSVPLYILLLSTIISKRWKYDRFRSTYYNLVIAQVCLCWIAVIAYLKGIMDVTAMVLYSTTYIPRAFDIATEFYWEYRAFIAPFSFNHSMFFMIVRCFDNALMALQRYFIVCRKATGPHFLKRVSLWLVCSASWLPPTLISIPIVMHWPQTFDSPEGLHMVTPPDHQKFCDIYQIIQIVITFSISIVAYYNVLKTILSSTMKRTLTREIRLSFVAMGQTIGFLMIVVYHILQWLVVHYDVEEAVRDIRTYFPLITGFESYSTVWLHLALNKDLRLEICSLCWSKSNVNQRARSGSRNRASPRGNIELRRSSNEFLTPAGQRRQQPSLPPRV